MRSYQKRAATELERRRKAFDDTMSHISSSKWSRGYTAPGRTKLKKR